MTPGDRDPNSHAHHLQQRFQEIMDDLRQEVTRTDEPQLKAIFETSAEVVGGLVKTLQDYEAKNEPAWRGTGGGRG